jgi:hypothetical protein
MSAGTRINLALRLTAALALGALSAAPLQAQEASGRAIFKCQDASGGAVYKDLPCDGPQATLAVWSAPSAPAREPGLSPEQPRSSAPADLRPMEVPEPRPFDAAAFARSPKAECPHLIQRIAFTESEERIATGGALRVVHERLAVQRKRYKELGCSAFG